MKFFPSVLAPVVLVAVFVLALLFGGPDNLGDQSIVRSLAAIRADSPVLTRAAVWLTQAGSAYATIGLGLIAAIWLSIAGSRGRALLVALGITGERIVADGMKWIVDRPRPSFDAHPVITNSSAFPSGHAANSMAAFLIVALVAAPARYRSSAIVAAVVASLAIGATRPYLGVHWPSDVVAGWCLGLLAAWIVVRRGERSGLLPVEPQHDIVGGHGAELGEIESA